MLASLAVTAICLIVGFLGGFLLVSAGLWGAKAAEPYATAGEAYRCTKTSAVFAASGVVLLATAIIVARVA